MVYIGSATYYNCSGTTACGDSCTSMSYHLAYPNVVGHPPDYSDKPNCGGGGMVPLSCGAAIELQNICRPEIINSIQVGDHGPGAACRFDTLFCDQPGTYVARRIDLTALAYMIMGGGPQGWVICKITTP